MALTCCVKSCSNGSYWLNKWKLQFCDVCGCLHKEKLCECEPPFRLFTFPTKNKNPGAREKWKQLVGRSEGRRLWSPPKDSRVCSRHFIEGEPTLQNPLPTLHMGYEGAEKRAKRMNQFEATRHRPAKEMRCMEKGNSPLLFVQTKNGQPCLYKLPFIPSNKGISYYPQLPVTYSNDVSTQAVHTSDGDHTYCNIEIPPTPSETELDLYNNCEYNACIDRSLENGNTVGNVINDTDIGETVTVEIDAFNQLFENLRLSVKEPFIVTRNVNIIRVMEFYKTMVKTCILIDRDNNVELYAHNKLVSHSNIVFADFGKGESIFKDVTELVNKLKTAHVCLGNPEQIFLDIVPDGRTVTSEGLDLAYREQNLGARCNNFVYNSTIRAVDCHLLLMSQFDRCAKCSRTRSVLRNRAHRRRDASVSSEKTYVHSNFKHANMDKTKFISKINEQKVEIKNLQKELTKLKGQLKKAVKVNGHRSSEYVGVNGMPL